MSFMNEYEQINEAGRKQAEVRRKCAIRFTAIQVGKGIAAVAVCWALNRIGFISDTFFGILAEGCALWAAFLCGVIWGQ
jgi:hypothetical protein